MSKRYVYGDQDHIQALIDIVAPILRRRDLLRRETLDSHLRLRLDYALDQLSSAAGRRREMWQERKARTALTAIRRTLSFLEGAKHQPCHPPAGHSLPFDWANKPFPTFGDWRQHIGPSLDTVAATIEDQIAPLSLEEKARSTDISPEMAMVMPFIEIWSGMHLDVRDSLAMSTFVEIATRPLRKRHPRAGEHDDLMASFRHASIKRAVAIWYRATGAKPLKGAPKKRPRPVPPK
ncbi:MAG: hypothetical protein LCH88_05320 [Proteobacteria bacterium]|nr:hypothetical protein [Pseudomonadota bacterium]